MWKGKEKKRERERYIERGERRGGLGDMSKVYTPQNTDNRLWKRQQRLLKTTNKTKQTQLVHLTTGAWPLTIAS
jgi:hypothetical protein